MANEYQSIISSDTVATSCSTALCERAVFKIQFSYV